MAKRVWLSVAVTAALLIGTGCTASSVTSPLSPGVYLRLHLDATSAAPGTDIHGTLTVNNNTATPIGIGCGHWFDIGLTNAEVAFDPFDGGPGCMHESTLPTGTSTYQVTVSTSWNSCTLPGAQRNPGMAICSDSPTARMPTLPVGDYTTKVVTRLPTQAAVHGPDPIKVRLAS